MAVDHDPQAEGFTYADEVIVHSAYDPEGILKKISAISSKEAIAGVVTQAARECVTTVASISDHLGLPHLIKDTAALTLRKTELSKRMNPQSLIQVTDNLNTLSELTHFPCILKWEGSSGGVGVHRADFQDEVKTIIAKVPKGKHVIVEQFVEGEHYGVLGLVKGEEIKVYGIAQKYLNLDLSLDKVIFPAVLDSDVERVILKYTRRVLGNLDFDFGPFQLEIILDADLKPFFVEIEPSIMGSYISEWMIPATSSNDMISDTIDLVCDGKFESYTRTPGLQALLKYHYASSSGVIDRVVIRDLDRRIGFRSYFNSGERIEDTKLYVANSFVVGKNLDLMEKMVNTQNVEVVTRT